MKDLILSDITVESTRLQMRDKDVVSYEDALNISIGNVRLFWEEVLIKDEN